MSCIPLMRRMRRNPSLSSESYRETRGSCITCTATSERRSKRIGPGPSQVFRGRPKLRPHPESFTVAAFSLERAETWSSSEDMGMNVPAQRSCNMVDENQRDQNVRLEERKESTSQQKADWCWLAPCWTGLIGRKRGCCIITPHCTLIIPYKIHQGCCT